MGRDILSQQEVDALLKGVTDEGGDDDANDWVAAMDESAVIEQPRKSALIETAEREIAYWTGVVHALTGTVKAPNELK